jgi:plasmid stability protein
MVLSMARITLKDVPDDLHAQLKQEASAHFRSLDGEVLARIEHSFEIEAALNTKRDQKWIDEALASGPEEPLSREKFDAAFQRAVKRHAAKEKAR